MRVILFFCIALFLADQTEAQITFFKGQQFVPSGGKFYGGGGVSQLSDSTYMVVGVEKTGLESSDLFLSKYKTNGEILSVRHALEDSAFFSVDLESVVYLTDGSFWSIGTYYSNGFDTSQIANFHYSPSGDLIGSIIETGGYSKLIQINDSLMAGTYVPDSADLGSRIPTKELDILRVNGSKVLRTSLKGDEIHFNGQNLYSERLVNDSLRWFRKIDMNTYNFIDSFSVTLDSYHEEFRFTKSEFIRVFYNPRMPELTTFKGMALSDYSISWSGTNGYIEGEKYTTIDFSFNDKTYYSDTVLIRLALTNDDNGRTVIAKLMPKGKFELLKVNYRYPKTGLAFYPKFQTLDKGFFGLAYDHFSPSSNFKIIKTDSIGQVLNSDYMGGVTFEIDSGGTTDVGTSSVFKSIKVFPNPTSGNFKISTRLNVDLNFKLISLNGQQVHSGEFLYETQLDVSHLPNGIYFLQLHGEGIHEIRKVVVSR